MDRTEVRVTVVYCAPGTEDISEVTLPIGATAADAVIAAGVLQRHVELEGLAADVGIWGCTCPPEQRLSDGDRVEIYRPLTIDPKEARRVRADIRRRRGGRR